LPADQFADHPSPGKYRGRPVEMIPVIERGFHEFFAIPNNRVAYISIIGRSLIPPELLPETQITSQVLDLIEKNADRNFMITASWSPPHDLWVIPEPYYSLVDRTRIELPGDFDMPAWDRRGPSKRLGDIMGPEGIREYVAIYHGMVKYIDDQVGRVLKKLDDLGLADNTLVIFTTDHGDMAGAHGCIGKSIFSFYDDLVRIPLLMRLPGRIRSGVVVRRPVSQVDVMPTILDYVGLPAPKGIHGRSLRPLIEGRPVQWRDYAFCQRADAGRMLRTERYKFTYRVKPRAVALYDLENDPHEDHNLADDPAHAKTVRQMHRRLVEAMALGGDPMVARYGADPLDAGE
jgi:arylsulfatase A-like enzyme